MQWANAASSQTWTRRAGTSTPNYQSLRDKVHAQLLVAIKIAQALGEKDLAQQLAHSPDGQFTQVDLAAPVQWLLTLVERHAEIEERMGPTGPKLAVANMHPWGVGSRCPTVGRRIPPRSRANGRHCNL